MYLKSLELMGFKSFGRKTVFDFQPGITAIIGPNGSGKSNVCDAIRWVLGEQSAKVLRGTKMSEVIFAGSSEFRPAAFSQVKLVLDNECRTIPVDYSEVSLARQLFRSGESNYILNNSRTLLSTVKEMLMDTGIGKDGYSVIGQGDIDDIIFQRTQSRRALIEEAAGITKFKHRKSSTLNKLNHTQTNITRLQDIIAEIESQLVPLEQQAEKTKKYQILAAEIRQLEIDLILFDLTKFNQERVNIESMRTGLLAKIEEIDNFLSEIDAKKLEARTKYLDFESIIDANQTNLKQISQQIELLQQTASKQREEIGGHQARKQAILEEISSIDNTLTNGNEEILEAQNRLSENEAQEINLTSEFSEIETQHNQIKTELEDHLREQTEDKDNAFQLAVKLADKKNRISTSTQQIQILERQLEKGESDVSLSQQKLSKLSEETKRLETEIQTIKQEIDTNRSHLNTETAQLNTTDKELRLKEEEYSSVNDQIKMSQARANLLDELRHSSESGIFKGVQATLALKETGRLLGICGMVGDLIKVPAGYETAFETALGGSIQDIITTDAETAKKAIEFLKQNRAGRATFLPLDMIQASSPSARPNFRGALGTALELIEYDAKYYNIMNYLLGRILIFDNIENAVEYTKNNRNFNRIVTIDGEIVRSSGALTGGATTTKTVGILSRKRELDELESKLARLKSKEAQLKTSIGSLQKNKNLLLQSIREKEETIHRRDQSLDFFCKTFEKNTNELEAIKTEYNQISSDRKELQSKLSELKTELITTQTELEKLEKQNIELSGRLNSMSGKESSIQDKLSIIASMLSDKKLEIAQIQERKKAITKEIEGSQKRLRESKERKNRAIAEVERLDSLLKLAVEELSKIQAEIDKQQQKKDNFEGSITEVQEEYKKISKEIEKLEHAFQSRVRIEESTRKKLSELDIKLAEVKTNIENKKNHLSADFCLDFDEITTNLYKYEDRQDLVDRTTKRKFEQEALEPVNPLAIEDYEKTKERFDFLNLQVADLTEAADSLKQVISEIEKISSERFLETFGQINRAFNDIFEILFPGGTGTLKLSTPQNPLESEIDIVCKLPGKNLSTLELFSGGEKALISLALLFSILQVKPPAFCLLDEVEAALDESNVKRFTRMLRSFANKTQFVLITHNKETMQAVDVIYGITLQKSGISKPVSIRLEDSEKIREFTVDKSGRSREKKISAAQAAT